MIDEVRQDTPVSDRGSSQIPLCVDLDGTLIHSDMLWESFVRCIKSSPLRLLSVPFWLVQGKAFLKARLAEYSEIDVAVLPYNDEVLKAVSAAKSNGRETVLISGSDRRHVSRVFDHLQIFDRFEASDGKVNLTGRRKAGKLVEIFGEGAFEYVANESVDLKVWQRAAVAGVANASRGVVRKAAMLGVEIKDYGSRKRKLSDWLRALRVHQWAKNALLFVPVITAHSVEDPNAVFSALVAFSSFGLCASATYILNDLMDLDADRHHKKKRNRPFAAGRIPIVHGISGGAIVFVAGLALALLLPVQFGWALAAYILTTVLYSFWFKRVASLDVITLATLYTLRIIAGAFAIGVPLSFWLLAFSMFIFLCLALVKRVTELLNFREAMPGVGSETSLRGREYAVEDISILTILGAVSGYLAVLVLALYINSDEVSLLYSTPEILWLIAPLMLLWVTRLWVVTTRGYMDDDPVFFAIRDPETWVTAAVTLLILVAATYISI